MSPKTHNRIEWIDLLRGAAMVLVVFGHALIGVTTSLETTRISRFLIIVVYSLHMPVLFVLAGCLSHRLMTRPIARFAVHVLYRIVWPYLLWGSLLLGLHYVMSQHTNTVIESYQPLSILWKPPAVMWFLFTLAIAVLLRRCLNSVSGIIVMAVGFGCVGMDIFLDGPIQNMRFIGLYLLASTILFDSRRDRPKAIWVGLSLIYMIFLLALAWQDASQEISGYPASMPLYLPALFASPCLAISLAQWLQGKAVGARTKGLLMTIGRHSMAVFVLHVFFTAGARMILLQLGMTDIWVVTACATGLGLLAPLALALWVSRLRLGRVLASGLGWQPG